MDNFQKTVELIKKRPTDIWGLRFSPSLEPEINDDQDHPGFFHDPPMECSDCNRAVVRELITSLGSNLHSIMEIGIARPENGQRSMSYILMEEKPRDCIYLGVDLDDRSYLDHAGKKIHTIRSSSFEQDTIRAWIHARGVSTVDLLFIDGWHSVNACINDWRYADLLSPGGVIVLHDTNAHPGCVSIFEAADPNIFSKERYCTTDDNGIAILRRRTA